MINDERCYSAGILDLMPHPTHFLFPSPPVRGCVLPSLVLLQADASWQTLDGLTPLHCLALSVCGAIRTPALAQRDASELQSKPAFWPSLGSMADTLLDAGAVVDAMDSKGNTPLLTAAWVGCLPLCEKLLARGLDHDARSVSRVRNSRWCNSLTQ